MLGLLSVGWGRAPLVRRLANRSPLFSTTTTPLKAANLSRWSSWSSPALIPQHIPQRVINARSHVLLSRSRVAFGRSIGTSPRRELPRHSAPRPLLLSSFNRRGQHTLSNKKVFTEKQSVLLEHEKQELRLLSSCLQGLGITEKDATLLDSSIKQLEDPFMLVVVGEFNSGKSSFLNALLGAKYLEEGVTPTTNSINYIKYGTGGNGATTTRVRDDQNQNDDSSVLVQVPVDWLRDINLVDTPGTNAILKWHQRLTEEFVPKADIVLFVTCVDRPFSESERAFLERIKIWKKKVVLILSKADLADDAELAEIHNFVSTNCRNLLDFEPTIYPISAKKALRSKLMQGEESQGAECARLWEESRFGKLEQYILETLSSDQRSALKLRNPIGVGQRLASKYEKALIQCETTLQGDVKTLQEVERRMTAFAKDMHRDFDLHLAKVDQALQHLEMRSNRYFSEKIRIGNILNLVQRSHFQRDFESAVVADVCHEVDHEVGAMIDWLLEKQSSFHNEITDYVLRRSKAVVVENKDNERCPSRAFDAEGVNVHFDYNRKDIIDKVGTGINDIVSYHGDKTVMSKDVYEKVRLALLQTAAIQVGAVGVGSVLATSLLDFTGILSASVIAVTGFAVLPYQRRQLRHALVGRIQELKVKVDKELNLHFSSILDRGVNKARAVVSPYAVFVESETERLQLQREDLMKRKTAMDRLASEIDLAFPDVDVDKR
eukprot:TRINITY_DN6329_c0_g1_i1.p1 TRINITY_DN6329_c0_g1~~TRINITY_DN6329_c0_g1_i1.p1  ORF type:complete len:720 (+),score=144.39 TRINITY_DN6329_c0_g1_i1:114-2273(+)